jgi:hypothetical protein
MSGVVSGLGSVVFDFEVGRELSSYMGLVFEEICKQYLLENAPLFARKNRQMAGQQSHEKRQEEIDILACRKDSALFCECKWTNAPVGMDVLDALARKSSLFHSKKVWLWLFSKTGLTDRLVREAEKHGNVRLVRFKDMFS